MNINSQDIILRLATQDDLPAVHNLVRELAKYEDAEKELTATIEYYQTEWEKGTFQSLVAELNGEIVGTCIYYITFSTWKGRMMYLEDFVVKDGLRHNGIGQQMYNFFLAEAKKEQCILAKWEVLDWNAPAIAFYEKNNAIIEKNWWDCKVFLDD